MKKQYMDFMPAKPVKKTVKKPVQKPASKAPVVSKVSTTPKVVSQPKKVQKLAPKVASQAKSTPKLGEIEDLTARYTEADLKKRPLGEKRQPEVKHAELAKIKAQKVGNKGVDFKEKSKVDSKAKEEKKTYKTPKSPFINQEKVVKRPLSKNVYRKARERCESRIDCSDYSDDYFRGGGGNDCVSVDSKVSEACNE